MKVFYDKGVYRMNNEKKKNKSNSIEEILVNICCGFVTFFIVLILLFSFVLY